MAERKPLVLIDGQLQELPVGDTVPGSGGGATYPAGGTTGQVLAKASNADNDVEWVDDQVGSGNNLGTPVDVDPPMTTFSSSSSSFNTKGNQFLVINAMTITAVGFRVDGAYAGEVIAAVLTNSDSGQINAVIQRISKTTVPATVSGVDTLITLDSPLEVQAGEYVYVGFVRTDGSTNSKSGAYFEDLNGVANWNGYGSDPNFEWISSYRANQSLDYQIGTLINDNTNNDDPWAAWFSYAQAAVYLEDAPSDGNQYARKDGTWEQVAAGGASYPTMSGQAGNVLAVNSSEDDVEWINVPSGADGQDGADGEGVPVGGTTGQILAKIDGTDYNTEWVDAPSGGGSASAFTDLTDTPASLGTAGQIPAVNGAADGLEWIDAPSGGSSGSVPGEVITYVVSNLTEENELSSTTSSTSRSTKGNLVVTTADLEIKALTFAQDEKDVADYNFFIYEMEENQVDIAAIIYEGTYSNADTSGDAVMRHVLSTPAELPKNKVYFIGFSKVGAGNSYGIKSNSAGTDKYINGQFLVNSGFGGYFQNENPTVGDSFNAFSSTILYCVIEYDAKLDVITDPNSGDLTVINGAVVTGYTTPDYNNKYGQGDRINSVFLSTNFPGTGNITAMIDGNTAANDYYFTNGQSSCFFDIVFPELVLLEEIKWYQDTTADHGTWKIQARRGTDDFVDIGVAQTLGGATESFLSMDPQGVGYNHYRLVQETGTTSSGPYLREIEFKVGNAIYGGGLYEAPTDGKQYARKNGDWAEIDLTDYFDAEYDGAYGSPGNNNSSNVLRGNAYIALTQLQITSIDVYLRGTQEVKPFVATIDRGDNGTHWSGAQILEQRGVGAQSSIPSSGSTNEHTLTFSEPAVIEAGETFYVAVERLSGDQYTMGFVSSPISDPFIDGSIQAARRHLKFNDTAVGTAEADSNGNGTSYWMKINYKAPAKYAPAIPDIFVIQATTDVTIPASGGGYHEWDFTTGTYTETDGIGVSRSGSELTIPADCSWVEVSAGWVCHNNAGASEVFIQHSDDGGTTWHYIAGQRAQEYSSLNVHTGPIAVSAGDKIRLRYYTSGAVTAVDRSLRYTMKKVG